MITRGFVATSSGTSRRPLKTSCTGSPRQSRSGPSASSWKTHVSSSRIRPVLLIDEAQEMPGQVLAELRILASADFDATSLLTVVLSGDGRLGELLRQDYLVPLGSRIRTRLVTKAGLAGGAAGSPPNLTPIKHRQCGDHDGAELQGHACGPQCRQLPSAHDDGWRAVGLWHG